MVSREPLKLEFAGSSPASVANFMLDQYKNKLVYLTTSFSNFGKAHNLLMETSYKLQKEGLNVICANLNGKVPIDRYDVFLLLEIENWHKDQKLLAELDAVRNSIKPWGLLTRDLELIEGRKEIKSGILNKNKRRLTIKL